MLTLMTLFSLVSFSVPAMAATTTNPNFNLALSGSGQISGSTLTLNFTAQNEGTSHVNTGATMFAVVLPPEFGSPTGVSPQGKVTCFQPSDEQANISNFMPAAYASYKLWACIVELNNQAVYASGEKKVSATISVAMITPFNGKREINSFMTAHGDEADFEITLGNLDKYKDIRKVGTNNVKTFDVYNTISSPQPTVPVTTAKPNTGGGSKSKNNSNVSNPSSNLGNTNSGVEVLGNTESFEFENTDTYSKVVTGKTGNKKNSSKSVSSFDVDPVETSKFGVMTWAKDNFLKVFLGSFIMTLLAIGILLVKAKMDNRNRNNPFGKDYRVKFGG